MAKPIEIGLDLTGNDALAFDEYIKNPVPTFTEEGKELMRTAILEKKNNPIDTSTFFF
ncbi:MAG TPA: hypothetical protein O0X70_03710 [Methanocorpusculum sp.]|nr:hypothetical protein [Methanocorpusculum sp.]